MELTFLGAATAQTHQGQIMPDQPDCILPQRNFLSERGASRAPPQFHQGFPYYLPTPRELNV